MRVRVCWSKVGEHGMIVMIESSLRLVQATFIALTLPASFPFVKAFQYRLLVRNYFRPSRLRLKYSDRWVIFITINGRQGPGFSSEIEIGIQSGCYLPNRQSPGAWLLV